MLLHSRTRAYRLLRKQLALSGREASLLLDSAPVVYRLATQTARFGKARFYDTHSLSTTKNDADGHDEPVLSRRLVSRSFATRTWSARAAREAERRGGVFHVAHFNGCFVDEEEVVRAFRQHRVHSVLSRVGGGDRLCSHTAWLYAERKNKAATLGDAVRSERVTRRVTRACTGALVEYVRGCFPDVRPDMLVTNVRPFHSTDMGVIQVEATHVRTGTVWSTPVAEEEEEEALAEKQIFRCYRNHSAKLAALQALGPHSLPTDVLVSILRLSHMISSAHRRTRRSWPPRSFDQLCGQNVLVHTVNVQIE